MVNFTHKQFKSVLNRLKYIDSWFWIRFTLNPYNGCQFGCIYCDSRSKKYHLPLQFEENIIIKTNVGQILNTKLSRTRTLLPDVVGLSGTTDPYQYAERKYKNTQQCLTILSKYNYPVHIITKSDLVLRDLDILENIGNKSWCSVSTTITTLNEKNSKFIEKKASSPQKRIDVIRTIKEKTKNISAGVLLMPVIPYLTDNPEELEDLISQAKEAKADYVLFAAGLTLRNLQANWFLMKLHAQFPDLVEKYEKLYHFTYDPNKYTGNYTPSQKYITRINKMISDLCKKYEIPIRMKRYIPTDYRRINYMIAEKMFNDAYILQSQNKSWKNKFWAAQNIQNLKQSIINLYKNDTLHEIKYFDDKTKKFIENECRDLMKTEMEFDTLDKWF